MSLTRRDFVAAAAAASAAFPFPIRAQDADPIRIGLVGCGGRGTGAAENCLKSAPNVRITAMGDVFPDKIERARAELAKAKLAGYQVEDKNCFVGLEAYKKVIEAVDLVLLCTPPGFRPIHFAEAVAAGKHVFMEKPVATDPAGVREVIEAGEKAKAKKLGVVAGTQYRHQASIIETIRKIHEGAIGRVRAVRAYYNTGSPGRPNPRREGMSDLEFQIRNWYYIDWLSGDHIIEQHVHTIDVSDWVIGARPLKASAVGGRTVRIGAEFGNVWDHFMVDYEYPDGVHGTSMCRQWNGADSHVGAYVAGSEGSASIYKGEIFDLEGKLAWKYGGEISIGKAYVQEHADLINSIRAGTPLNEARQIAESSLTGILGREAAYTGKDATWEQMMTSPLNLRPENVAELGPAPLRDVPMPGKRR